MTARVISLAEAKRIRAERAAAAEREAIRDYMLGSYRKRSNRWTLDEIMGVGPWTGGGDAA